jgi:hypothetical protein
VKIRVESGEFWPWYWVKDDDAYAYAPVELDVPEETVQRWRDAIAAAVAVQAEIKAHIEAPGDGGQ